MAKNCLICGAPVGFFEGQVELADGFICENCWSRSGGSNAFFELATARRKYTSHHIIEKINSRGLQPTNISNFSPTLVLDNFEFDDNSKLVKIKPQLEKAQILPYSDIINFGLLENNKSITKGGLGQAITGGVLFGDIGATVGAITGRKITQTKCESLKIKVTVRNRRQPAIFVEYLSFAVKKSSFVYKTAFENAHRALSALQCAVDSTTQSEFTLQPDATDEIRKYKQLFDEGIITAEEFEAKKKQIMDI